MNENEIEEITYPSIVFKVHNGLYAINSRYITTLLQKPAFENLPDAPDFLTGIFRYRESVIQMLDLRSFLGLPTLEQQSEEFIAMLEKRKKEHIDWAETLIQCVQNHEPFSLATDPHQCAFGRWYDNFRTENTAISHILDKVDKPHTALHRSAAEALACGDDTERAADILKKVQEEYMPQVTGALDEVIHLVQEGIYHEMVLVLSGDTQLGLVVDEVLAVSELAPADALAGSQKNHCISGAVQDVKTGKLILEVDVPKMLQMYDAKLTQFQKQKAAQA